MAVYQDIAIINKNKLPFYFDPVDHLAIFKLISSFT